MLRLPVPPSVNGMYFNLGPGRGRAKTKKYTAWLAEADQWYALQGAHKIQQITGPREIHILLPKVRGDASNRIKAAEDYLVSRGLTGDDKDNRKVTVEVDGGLGKYDCWITVTASS